MLDISIIRNNPEVVRSDLKKRGMPSSSLEKVIELDKQKRDLLVKVEALKKRRNELTKQVSETKSRGESASKFLKEVKEIPDMIKNLDGKIENIDNELSTNLMRIPNILHRTVPSGKDDSENIELRKWGTIKKFSFQVKDHQDLAKGMIDVERAAKISGSRFYFLKGDLALLNQAVLSFTLKHLIKKGFTPVQPPYMMRRKPYEGVSDVEDFEKVMYKVEDEDLYMIATSEHPLVSMYMDEKLDEKELPIKLAGISTCFRKEAGSHGKDTKGIFRVHQFDKIEQIIFSRPEDSWNMLEELMNNTEEIFQQLCIPYRIVNVCTGDIGKIASKKYDLEAWLPAQKQYREMASCSNCTDYQARRLNIKYASKDATAKGLVHILNNTGIASPRILVAILENNQKEDGSIEIPKVLQDYMGKKTIEP